MSSKDTPCHPEPPERPLRFLRMAEVAERVGLHKRTIARKVKDESFPQPVPLGNNAAGFVEAEVEAWMRDRMASRRNPDSRDE